MTRNAKVLIVDDDEMGSKPFVLKLQKRGIQVHFSTSGENILELLEQEPYNVVFLDMVMPEFTGHQVLGLIRSKYSQLEIPVIMLSGKDEVSDVVESLKLGANDYMTKPANIDIAMARIQTQLMLTEYYKISVKKSELDAIHSMVVTYSHEINNPLTIALGFLHKLKGTTDQIQIEKVESALHRISHILSKIKQISEGNDKVEFENYLKGSQGRMLKLKK